MTVPKFLMVAGHKVRIKVLEDLQHTGEAFGCFSPATMTIYLDASLSGDHLREVLCHEWLEAVNSLFEMHLEHAAIQSLGVHLNQLLKQLAPKSVAG